MRPAPSSLLNASQSAALDFVRGRSSGGLLDAGLRVTINFHPDRLHAGVPILRRMLGEGVYRSQFETGTSNGGLTESDDAARDGRHDPQQLKKVWHMLARYGDLSDDLVS